MSTPSERSSSGANAPVALMLELIRQALGKIAQEVAEWPLEQGGDARIVAAVTDASTALEALERLL